VAFKLAAVVGSDWTLAASIMTFAIPVALFVVVATVLYFLYTRPHSVPGHRDLVPATGATGSGRHAAGAPRPAAQQAPAQRPPAAPPEQPPGGGYSQGGGYPQGGGGPGGGGYGRHDGMEGR
jgi:hypothetical protein